MEGSEKYQDYAVMLNQCDKELDEMYHTYAMQRGISDSTLWVLYAVYDAKDPLTQAELCNGWFFSRQTINTALKSLENQGIVTLVPISGNRKSKQIVFTEEGKDTALQILQPLLDGEKRVYDGLSDEENRIFAELFRKRCALLREYLTAE